MQSISQRQTSLHQIAKALRTKHIQDELIELLVADTNLPVDNLRLRECEMAAAFLEETRVESSFPLNRSLNLENRNPLGKVVGILPGNGPIYTLAKVLAPAHLMGNKTEFKLPSRMRNSQKMIRELFCDHIPELRIEYPSGKAGKEKILYDALTGADTNAVVIFGDDTWIAHFSRISKETGTKMIFEGPGNDPAVVFPGADLDRAARDILKGTFYNGGQSCSAIKRVYVHAEVMEAFKERLLEHVTSFRYGPPSEPGVMIGPIYGDRLLARIHRQMENAAAGDAQFVYGDGSVDENRIYRPTILECRHESEIVLEETFYSVMPLVSFETEAEVRAYITETRYGLNACVYGNCRPEFISYLWMMHKAVSVDSLLTAPENQHLLRLVGGYKSSGFIGEWYKESHEHGYMKMKPVSKGSEHFHNLVDHMEDMCHFKYIFRKGRFYLEEELSTAVQAPVEFMKSDDTETTA